MIWCCFTRFQKGFENLQLKSCQIHDQLFHLLKDIYPLIWTLFQMHYSKIYIEIFNCLFLLQFKNQYFRSHFFMSRWKQYFLVCLRSNILQVLMSLLVLLDAGIVISEIVLEIQSLQSKLNSIIIDIYIYHPNYSWNVNSYDNKTLSFPIII